MALTLVVLSGNTSEELRITLDAPRIVVGRAANSDVRLPDYSVSQRHASFRQRGTDYLIVDEGSTNGTFVGPVRLSPQATRVVRSGDQLRFGRIWVEVRIESIPTTHQAKQAAQELATQLVTRALLASNETTAVRLVIEAGPDEGSTLAIELPEHRYVLGRAPTCDLVLAEANASRRHVEVFHRGGQMYARDLGSKNGTVFARLPLPSKSETAWPAGATMQIGNDRIILVDPISEALAEIEQAVDEVVPQAEEVPNPGATRKPANPLEMTGPTPTMQRRSGSERPGSERSRFSTPELLVGLIALLVIGSSLCTLFWLLGGL